MHSGGTRLRRRRPSVCGRLVGTQCGDDLAHLMDSFLAINKLTFCAVGCSLAVLRQPWGGVLGRRTMQVHSHWGGFQKNKSRAAGACAAYSNKMFFVTFYFCSVETRVFTAGVHAISELAVLKHESNYVLLYYILLHVINIYINIYNINIKCIFSNNINCSSTIKALKTKWIKGKENCQNNSRAKVNPPVSKQQVNDEER